MKYFILIISAFGFSSLLFMKLRKTTVMDGRIIEFSSAEEKQKYLENIEWMERQ